MPPSKHCKTADEDACDWVDVFDGAVNLRFALPITPAQKLSECLRQKLLARPDAEVAIIATQGMVEGAKTVRAEQAQRAREGKAARRAADPDAVSPELIRERWEASDRAVPGRFKKVVDGEVVDALKISPRRVERARLRR
jgi:hypothetical protein